MMDIYVTACGPITPQQAEQLRQAVQRVVPGATVTVISGSQVRRPLVGPSEWKAGPAELCGAG